MTEPWLLGAGLGSAVGMIMALTGAGGGILAVPLLVFGLGLGMSEAAPIGLLAVGLAAAVGAGLGLRRRVVRYRAAVYLAFIGVLLTPLGVWLAQRLPERPLMVMFACVLLYSSIRTLRRLCIEQRLGAPLPYPGPAPCVLDPLRGRLRWTLPCVRMLTFTGALAGLLSGLLGVGGGFVIVPALSRYSNLNRNSIAATSLAVIALVSTGSVVSAGIGGGIRWPLALPFASGAVLGLLVGLVLAKRLAGPRLQQVFAVLMLGVAVLLAARGIGVMV